MSRINGDVADRQGELVCPLDYHRGRRTSLALRYRLSRRASEVVRVTLRYLGLSPHSLIIDVGTADTLMIQRVCKQLGHRRCVGVDMSYALLSAGRNLVGKDVEIACVQGNAIMLPFASSCASLVVCAAVIEHVSSPRWLIAECHRVLRPGGLCVVTTADPQLLRLATRLRFFSPHEADRAMRLDDIAEQMREVGIVPLEARKFMISPIGFPFELWVEKVMAWLGLDLFFLNQIIVGRRGVGNS